MTRAVSVVIPARNDSEALPTAVESVLAQAGVDELEIVIAVGPSVDETERVARSLEGQFESVKVVSNPSGLTAVGLNLAITHTRHSVIARVDARSVLPAGYLVAALETMHATGAANVGAIQDPIGTTRTQRGIAAAMKSSLGSGGASYRGTSRVRQATTGYLGVFQRGPLLSVGCFDEASVRNQDAELNMRLIGAGHEVWVDPRMVVSYSPRSTIATLATQYWQYGWWRRRTIRKHAGSAQLRQLVPPIAVVSLLVALVVATVWPWALLLPALYLVALCCAAVSAKGLRLIERLVVPVALITIHFVWSFGFMASSGVLILKR